MLDDTTRQGTPEEEKQFYRREYVNFSDVVHFIRRYFSTIAISITVGIAAAVLYLLLAQPIFTASARLLIEPKLPQVLRDNLAEPSYTLDSSQLESHTAVLESQFIAMAVIKKLGLIEDPEFQAQHQNDFITQLKGMLLFELPFEKDATQDDYVSVHPALERFNNRLEVQRVGISYAIDVSFSSRNAKKAARIANAIVESYLQSLLDARAEATRVGSEWLEESVARLRVQMNAAARRAQQARASQDYRIASRSDGSVPTEKQAGQQATVPASEPMTLEELELTAETYRKLYESFYLAFAEAVHRQSYPVSNVRIISKAMIPARKSHPKTLFILALGALIGTLVGLSVGFVRQNLR